MQGVHFNFLRGWVGSPPPSLNGNIKFIMAPLSDTDFNCMMVSVSDGHSLNSSMSVNASLECPQSPRAQGKISDDQMTSLEQGIYILVLTHPF